MTIGKTYSHHLAWLVDEARSIQVAALDGASLSEVQERVVPGFVRLLEEAIQAVARLETKLGEAAEEEAGLLDLCYVVRGELEQRLGAFDRLRDAGDLWVHLEALEWAQHELIRGLCAVESHLARSLDTPSETRDVDLLVESLAVRELTARFRGDLADISKDGADGVAPTLEAASASLVRLTARNGFARLRALDRRMARQLHRQIVDWLQHPAPELEDGTHLWQEVQNFSVLLHDISRRSELVAHDLGVLDEVIDLLAGVDPGRTPPGRVIDRLSRLVGLDDELDALVQRRAKGTEVEARVQRLYDSLRSRWSLDAERDPLRELAAQT